VPDVSDCAPRGDAKSLAVAVRADWQGVFGCTVDFELGMRLSLPSHFPPPSLPLPLSLWPLLLPLALPLAPSHSVEGAGTGEPCELGEPGVSHALYAASVQRSADSVGCLGCTLFDAPLRARWLKVRLNDELSAARLADT
jgi:hypothetical protein